MSNRSKWTFMVYLSGDNSLSSAGDKDLKEMRAVGSTPDVNVVAQFDNAGNRGTTRHLVQRGGADDTVEALGETDSGSPEALSDFIDWAAKTYPADRYALVLWSHGNGWVPTEMDRIAREVGSADYSVREAKDRAASPLGKALFRSTLKRIFRLPRADRAICIDDGSGHSLDTIELGAVLSRAVKTLGQPIDLLGMDACLMSNLEVAYQSSPYARYMVASEESEPTDGWPYDVVLGKLAAEPDLPTADLAKHVVASYVRSYVESGSTAPVTQSAMDLSRVDQIVKPIDRLAGLLTAQMPEARAQIWGAQFHATRFWQNTLWDIGHFVSELAKLTRDSALKSAAEDVSAALRTGPGRFLLAEQHHGKQVNRCSGLSIYLPAMTDVSPYYEDLAFAKMTKSWLSMLRAYRAE